MGMLRIGAALLALLITLGLVGCQPAGQSPDDPRDRIIDIFDPDTLPHRLAADESTDITELTEQALGDWQIYDLLNIATTHPLRVRVALSADGQGHVLSGWPENYQLISAQVPVPDADAATARALDFLDLTNPYTGLLYQVTTPDDIRWLKSMDAEQEATKDAFTAEYGPQLGPATATTTDDGWQVESWWMYQDGLRRYQIQVASDGGLTSEFDDVVGDLPTSIGT